MLIGYARISTDDQKTHLQRDALIKAGVLEDYIYEETASGAGVKRPVLEMLFKTLRADDVLVVWKLDRLGRSLKELLLMMEQLEKIGAGFRSLSEHIDTTTPAGRMIFSVFGAVAQFERDLIRERTMAGLAAARARGRFGGNRPISEAKQKAILDAIAAGEMVPDVARKLKLSKATIYRYVNAAKADDEPKQ